MTHRSRRRRAIVELLRDVGRAARRAAADHAPGEVLRAGRPPARDRHHPPVVHPQRRPRRRPARDAARARRASCSWHPDHMRHRYENWVEGLNGDWLISRQRFFGVPIPVWYPLDADGEPDLRPAARCPTRTTLPIDPSTDVPAGLHRRPARPARRVHRRPRRHGHVGDVVAHARRSPAGWVDDPDLFARVFPMDMRPQAHDIIRTWLFATRRARALRARRRCRGANAAISGWILDPDRKKMSKSKGNVVTPMPLLEQYGTDAVRYWAAYGPPGRRHRVRRGPDEDRPQARHQAAQRQPSSCSASATAPRRRRRRHRPARPVDARRGSTTSSTRRPPAFEGFDYARALERTEAFFWWFCDDYVELVKGRAYGTPGTTRPRSARPPCAPRPRRCTACSPRSCRSSPKRSGAGGTRARSTGAAWPEADALVGRRPPATDVDRPRPRRRGARRQVRRAKTEAKVSQRAAVDRRRRDLPGERDRPRRDRPRRPPRGRHDRRRRPDRAPRRHPHGRRRPGRAHPRLTSRRRLATGAGPKAEQNRTEWSGGFMTARRHREPCRRTAGPRTPW